MNIKNYDKYMNDFWCINKFREDMRRTRSKLEIWNKIYEPTRRERSKLEIWNKIREKVKENDI